MPVPLADFTAVETIVASTLGLVGTAIGIWGLWQRTRNKSRADEQASQIELNAARRRAEAESEQVERESRQQAKDEELKSLRELVNFLSGKVTKLNEAYGVLQASVTEKLIQANNEHHKCREETAVVKEELRWTKEQLTETKQRLARAEARIAELEQQGH